MRRGVLEGLLVRVLPPGLFKGCAAAFVVACGSLVSQGCSSRSGQLPRYAEPTSESVDSKGLEGGDRIAYRKLTPKDFRASAPPPEMKKYAERMGAVTCAHVYTEPDPQYYVQQTPEGFDGAYQRLSFVAKMDRECSWWNPKKSHVPEGYILQHEQIHFALAEVTARQLNVKARIVLRELHPSGPTQKSVEKVLVGTIEEMMAEAIAELMDRNLAFDKETSNTHAPEVQQRWYDEVMAELESLAGAEAPIVAQ